MALNSINTNAGALIALQNLNTTNSELQTVQQRINTGKKVASAKDNGAIWATAKNQSSTASSLNAVKDSLQRGQSTIDVALAAGDTITDLLGKMKEKALAASDTSLNTASFNALKADFESLRDQVTKAASNAKFNGVSIADGTTTKLTFLANCGRLGLHRQCADPDPGRYRPGDDLELHRRGYGQDDDRHGFHGAADGHQQAGLAGHQLDRPGYPPHLRRQAARQPRRRRGQPG